MVNSISCSAFIEVTPEMRDLTLLCEISKVFEEGFLGNLGILEDSLGVPWVSWGFLGFLRDSKEFLRILCSKDRGDSRDSAGFLGDFRGFSGFTEKVYVVSEVSSFPLGNTSSLKFRNISSKYEKRGVRRPN